MKNLHYEILENNIWLGRYKDVYDNGYGDHITGAAELVIMLGKALRMRQSVYKVFLFSNVYQFDEPSTSLSSTTTREEGD
jgi:hypothetical protein